MSAIEKLINVCENRQVADTAQAELTTLRAELAQVQEEINIQKRCRDANADARDFALNERDAARAERDTLKGEVERLREEVKALRSVEKASDRIQSAQTKLRQEIESELTSHRLLLDELAEAGQPFKRLADCFDVEPYNLNWPDQSRLNDEGTLRMHNFLTLGDCRKIKATLAKYQQQCGEKGKSMRQKLDAVRTLAVKLYEAGQVEKRKQPMEVWGSDRYRKFRDMPSEGVAVWDAIALAALKHAQL